MTINIEHNATAPAPLEALDEIAATLAAQARADGVNLTGDGGLLTGLIGRVLEGALDVEMTNHVGYQPHAVAGRGSGNSRNGTYPKTVRTKIGDVESWCLAIATARSSRSRSQSANAGSRDSGLGTRDSMTWWCRCIPKD
jgi:hypothetical protein